MGLFTKMSNGWDLAISSIKVLNKNKQLVIFPILSGICMAAIIASFVLPVLYNAHWETSDIHMSRGTWYLLSFLFYIVNFFVVVFFNMALVYCAKQYFDNKEVSVAEGLKFSIKRIHTIFLWAVFAATIGILLRMLQDKLGWLGKIIIGLTGIAWSIATYLIVPVLAFENLSPFEALKRSAQLMKEKWGESIGANFSLGVIAIPVFVLLIIMALAIGYYINDAIGIAILVGGFVLIMIIMSALKSIFISALYNNVKGIPSQQFDFDVLNKSFE